MRGSSCFVALFVIGCGGVDRAPLPPEIMVTADLGSFDLAPVAAVDLAPPLGDLAPAPADAKAGCEWSGAPGSCLSATACGAMVGHSAETGCAGGLSCCIVTPNVANDPPVPSGWKLMQQAQVTTDMTNWAVMILHDPVTYPMFSTTMRTFGAQPVLARVEWHPPDFQNSVVHRGVTLYVPQ